MYDIVHNVGQSIDCVSFVDVVEGVLVVCVDLAVGVVHNVHSTCVFMHTNHEEWDIHVRCLVHMRRRAITATLPCHRIDRDLTCLHIHPAR